MRLAIACRRARKTDVGVAKNVVRASGRGGRARGEPRARFARGMAEAYAKEKGGSEA